jgi:hypothetical protein
MEFTVWRETVETLGQLRLAPPVFGAQLLEAILHMGWRL